MHSHYSLSGFRCNVRTEGASFDVVIYLMKHSDKGLILLYDLF